MTLILKNSQNTHKLSPHLSTTPKIFFNTRGSYNFAPPFHCGVCLLPLPYFVLVLVVAGAQSVERLYILDATEHVAELLHGVHR